MNKTLDSPDDEIGEPPAAAALPVSAPFSLDVVSYISIQPSQVTASVVVWWVEEGFVVKISHFARNCRTALQSNMYLSYLVGC